LVRESEAVVRVEGPRVEGLRVVAPLLARAELCFAAVMATTDSKGDPTAAITKPA